MTLSLVRIKTPVVPVPDQSSDLKQQTIHKMNRLTVTVENPISYQQIRQRSSKPQK